jgi:hypothetical protein
VEFRDLTRAAIADRAPLSHLDNFSFNLIFETRSTGYRRGVSSVLDSPTCKLGTECAAGDLGKLDCCLLLSGISSSECDTALVE